MVVQPKEQPRPPACSPACSPPPPCDSRGAAAAMRDTGQRGYRGGVGLSTRGRWSAVATREGGRGRGEWVNARPRRPCLLHKDVYGEDGPTRRARGTGEQRRQRLRRRWRRWRRFGSGVRPRCRECALPARGARERARGGGWGRVGACGNGRDRAHTGEKQGGCSRVRGRRGPQTHLPGGRPPSFFPRHSGEKPMTRPGGRSSRESSISINSASTEGSSSDLPPPSRPAASLLPTLPLTRENKSNTRCRWTEACSLATGKRTGLGPWQPACHCAP